MKKSSLSLALLPLMLATACGGGDTPENNTAESLEAVNQAPEVSISSDQTVAAGDEVTISVTVSDDDEVTVAWHQSAGASVTFELLDENTLTFTAPQFDTDTMLTFVAEVSDGVNDPVVASVDITVTSTGAESSNWIINNETTSTYISSATGSVLEDVQLVQTVNTDGADYVYVEASGIPKYEVTISQDMVDQLNQRPKASTDFIAGTTSAYAGQVVEFGEDIGYRSSRTNCTTTGGDGYWPPGPECPTNQGKQVYFPAEPAAQDDEDCETGLGPIGLMVNGTSIFNWWDGQSVSNNQWLTLAPIAEQYDVDICGGHAAQGNYHHHFYTTCLANLVGDDASQHSPIYGYSADGYPLYGPYESTDTLAVSGWKTRDYGASVNEAGCDTEGERSCVLVDPYDISKGVTQVANGPGTDETVTTLSGNRFVATSGYYFEDYYYAGEAVEGARLDENNGHDTQDGRGYHYHITLTKDENGKLTPAFPFTIGPNFKGKLGSNAIAQCGGTALPPLN